MSLLDASVKVPAPTSIVVAPSPVGVKVAVYVVPFTFAAKLDKFPPVQSDITFSKVGCNFASLKRQSQSGII